MCRYTTLSSPPYTTGRFPRQAYFSTLKMEAAGLPRPALVPIYQTTRRHIRHTVRTARNTPCATLNSYFFFMNNFCSNLLSISVRTPVLVKQQIATHWVVEPCNLLWHVGTHLPDYTAAWLIWPPWQPDLSAPALSLSLCVKYRALCLSAPNLNVITWSAH